MKKSILAELFSLVSPETSGKNLYQKIWELVNDNLFDVEKLSQWKNYKHRFDRQIRTSGDAVTMANQALANLGDRHNRVYTQEQDRNLRSLIHNQYAVRAKELDCGVGFLYLQDFLPWNTTDQLERGLCQLAGCRSVVLDLRGNGGGDIEQATYSLGLFLKEGPLVTFKTRMARGGISTMSLSLSADAMLTREEGSLTVREEKSPRRAFALGDRRLAVLVDEQTASAAELFALALQENGVPLVGARTCGKGIGQRHFNLADELDLSGPAIALQVTNCRYYSPRGAWLGDDGQSVASGVIPNFTVSAGDDLFETGSSQDLQLQKATRMFVEADDSCEARRVL